MLTEFELLLNTQDYIVDYDRPFDDKFIYPVTIINFNNQVFVDNIQTSSYNVIEPLYIPIKYTVPNMWRG